MLYLCKLITDRSGMKGIRIFECRGLDSLVVIPEEIKGQPVIELAPYIFSAQEDYEPEDRIDAFWWGEGVTIIFRQIWLSASAETEHS